MSATLLVLASTVTTCANAQTAPSAAALKKSIQANYLNINTLAQTGQLKTQLRECPGLGPEFSLLTDRTGKARRYVVIIGSDDSALTLQHDYDTAGRLTFVLGTHATVHGQKGEWRLYFAPSGRMIDVVRSGSSTLPEDLIWHYLTRDPLADWTLRWCP